MQHRNHARPFIIGWLLLSGFLVWASPLAHSNVVASPQTMSFIEEITSVLLLQDYNTRLVVLSTTLLGISAGLVGSFLLLRKRSLMGDALSHACLPGIGIAFMVMVAAGGTGKSLVGLLVGATLSGILGVFMVMWIRNSTRLKDDAAMGIVLSVFFGLGVAILGMVQEIPHASAAGLEQFIYGKAASMVFQDFLLTAGMAALTLVLSSILHKEFMALTFDEAFTASLGWHVRLLDLVLMGLVTAVTVIGLQSVGLILIIAFLITPAAAARFWTNDLRKMLALAGGIGGLSGWLGASISALAPRLPAGAVIVLVAASLFTFSMLLGSVRGVLVRYRAYLRLRRKIGRQHLLRAVYEVLETKQRLSGLALPENEAVTVEAVLAKRSWALKHLRRLLRKAKREDHVEYTNHTHIHLSEAGFGEAMRITRNHRLWETYLITHADVAPQHVDRDADKVEHVLSPEVVRELERVLLQKKEMAQPIPSPHLISTQGEGI